MKKIAFMLCAAAFLGTMSSCSSDSDETVTVTNRGAKVTRTLVVTANTLSDFTYGGKTIRSTEATFENAPVNGMLKVTPVSADYFDQDAMSIDFGTQATLAYDVQLAKKPTLEVSQEEMLKGQIVTNDQENSEMTGVKASIQVPSTTQITGNTTSPFSITTYVPTETGQWLTRGENTGEAKVLVIRCAADGAKFSEPVIVTLDIPESDGLDLVCVSEDGKEVLPLAEIGGGKRQVLLSHFSDWTTVMRATPVNDVTRATPGTEVTTQTINVTTAGPVTITYQSKAGGVWLSGKKSTTITNYIKNNLGKYVVSNVTSTTPQSIPVGKLTYRVIQTYEDGTYKSGSSTFKARKYTGATIEVDIPQGGHSGGAGH